MEEGIEQTACLLPLVKHGYLPYVVVTVVEHVYLVLLLLVALLLLGLLQPLLLKSMGCHCQRWASGGLGSSCCGCMLFLWETSPPHSLSSVLSSSFFLHDSV